MEGCKGRGVCTEEEVMMDGLLYKFKKQKRSIRSERIERRWRRTKEACVLNRRREQGIRTM